MPFLPFSRLVVVAVLLVFAAPSLAEYYRWTDEHGVTHFSDGPPGPDGKPVRPNGTSVIPMRENIRTQRQVEQINNRRPVRPDSPKVKRVEASASQWDKEQRLREEKRLQLLCKNYEERIDWIDSRLRAGGYSVGQGNRLRAERRDISNKRAWECLRN